MKFSNYVKSALAISALGFLTLGLTSTPAGATAVPTTFTVTATVQASCSIAAPVLAFGNYVGAAIQQNTTITVSCNGTVPTYDIGLSQGTYGTGPYARNMANGASRLSYGLYQDTGLTTNWGITTGAGGDTYRSTTGVTSVKVYGQVFANQAPPLGAYSDTITATITY